MKSRFPVVAFAVVLPALAACVWPQLSQALVYQREAILHGELWRLMTGNWVHFSAQHLFLDAAVFTICGTVLEARDRRLLVRFCLLCPASIGIAILGLEPGIENYGGLSGVATGSMALLALQGINSRSRAVSWLMLGGIAGKICCELGTGRMLFVQSLAPGLAVMPLAHLIGVLTAVAVSSYNFDLVPNPNSA